MKHFVAGTTARTAAKLVGVQGRTAVVFFQRLRRIIASHHPSFVLSAKITSDDHTVTTARPGRRSPAHPVFGLIMRDGKVYTATIEEADAQTLTTVGREAVTPDSIICAKHAQTHHTLNVSEWTYTCLNPVKTVLSRSGHHINGVENFWNESRRYLRRFNGIPATSLYWYLKECEWRFNESDHQALSMQLKYWYQSVLTKP